MPDFQRKDILLSLPLFLLAIRGQPVVENESFHIILLKASLLLSIRFLLI